MQLLIFCKMFEMHSEGSDHCLTTYKVILIDIVRKPWINHMQRKVNYSKEVRQRKPFSEVTKSHRVAHCRMHTQLIWIYERKILTRIILVKFMSIFSYFCYRHSIYKSHQKAASNVAPTCDQVREPREVS